VKVPETQQIVVYNEFAKSTIGNKRDAMLGAMTMLRVTTRTLYMPSPRRAVTRQVSPSQPPIPMLIDMDAPADHPGIIIPPNVSRDALATALRGIERSVLQDAYNIVVSS
jgi:hypothetical protein